MGKKSSSAPKPPDPVVTANAQAAVNKETADAVAKNSAIDQYTPYGSITYKRNKNGVPTAATQKLTPEAQKVLDYQMNAAKDATYAAAKLGNSLPTSPMSTKGVVYDPSKYGSNIVADFKATNLPYDPTKYGNNLVPDAPTTSTAPYDPSKISGDLLPEYVQSNLPYDPRTKSGDLLTDFSSSKLPYDPRSMGNNLVPDFQEMNAPFDPRSYGDMNLYAQEAGDAYFNQAWSRLAPAQEQEFDRRVQWLADQGLPVGSKAWNTSYGAMTREQNDARSSIANQAATIAGQEAQRRLGMEQSVRDAAFSEHMTNYNARASEADRELAAKMGLRDQAFGEDVTSFQNRLSGQQAEYDLQSQLRQQAFNEDNTNFQNNMTAALNERNLQQQINQSAFNQAQQLYQQQAKAAQDEIAQQQALRQAALNQQLAVHQQQNTDKANEIQTQQQLRNQIIQEMLTGRNQNINEFSALMTGQGALQMPQQVGGGAYSMATPDLAGLIQGGYQNQMAAYNQNQQNASNTWQTAASAAGTLLPLMKCSRDYKYDDAPSERVLDLAARIPVRTWKYKDENVVHIGPYAEDWQRITGLGNGKEISVVDAFGVCLKSIQDLKDDVDSLKRRVA